MDSRLREAAQTGNIDILYEVIQEDPYVLERVDGVPFVDTPLHVAAVEGQINFAMEMMNLKPSFARKLNPQGFSPLHLALNHQQTKLVLQILKTDKELVRVKGKIGVTPFHLTAITGDTELLLQFLQACPECIQDLTVKGETALMLALRNKHLETFEAMVRWLEKSQHKDAHIWEESIVNHRDNEDQTALQIADQDLPEAAKLLQSSHLAVDVDAVNLENLTMSAKIIKRKQRIRISKRNRESELKIKYMGSKLSFWDRRSILFGRAKNNMSMDFVNALLVVAALIITAAYQSSLSPPGSVWQGDNSGSSSPMAKSNFFTVGKHKAGSTVMNQTLFILYLAFNSFTIWSGILLIKRLFPRGAFLLTVPLYLLGASFQLSMCVLSPNTWILRMQYVLFLCVIVFPALWKVPQMLKDCFRPVKQPDDPIPDERIKRLLVLAFQYVLANQFFTVVHKVEV